MLRATTKNVVNFFGEKSAPQRKSRLRLCICVWVLYNISLLRLCGYAIISASTAWSWLLETWVLVLTLALSFSITTTKFVFPLTAHFASEVCEIIELLLLTLPILFLHHSVPEVRSRIWHNDRQMEGQTAVRMHILNTLCVGFVNVYSTC